MYVHVLEGTCTLCIILCRVPTIGSYSINMIVIVFCLCFLHVLSELSSDLESTNTFLVHVLTGEYLQFSEVTQSMSDMYCI